MINWHRKLFRLTRALDNNGVLFPTLMLKEGTNEFWLEPTITTSDPTLHFRIAFAPGDMKELWTNFTFVAKGSEPLQVLKGAPIADQHTERLEAEVVIYNSAASIALYIERGHSDKLYIKYTQLDGGGGDDGWGAGQQVP